MHAAGCQRVVELSWWQQHQLVRDAAATDGVGVRFACVPSQHWSKRGVLDDNKVSYDIRFFNVLKVVFFSK